MKATIIALTGFMGAGKTCIGRALAALLGWSFVDLDQEIELRQHLRIAEIFQRDGESRFREIESKVLDEVLARISGSTVLALGGGTFVERTNAKLLSNRDALVVFLHAPVEQLLQRCRGGCQDGNNPRPLAADPEAFRLLYAQRLPCYRKANITVEADRKTIQEVAIEIASALQLEHEES